MIIKNYLKGEATRENAHHGTGKVKNVKLFSAEEFATDLEFLIYTELEPGTSIGKHQHGQNEELYVILEGEGVMTVNDEQTKVETGDVILNKLQWSHSLKNNSDKTVKLLVFEVAKGD